MKELLFCVLAVCVTEAHAGVSATDMNTHLTTTFTNYDSRVRPLLSDQSQAVGVSVDLHLLGINNFDSSEQKLETTAFLEITWTDEVLHNQWHDPDVPEVLIPQSDIWLPDLALQNGFETLTGLGNKFYNVRVKSTGVVTWRPYHVFESACAVDVTYFPFDRTTCELKFVVWSNPKNLLMATVGTGGLDMTGFSENSEWSIELTEANNFETTTSSGVTFAIQMKRKPLFYLLNILIPVIMLAVLNAFVFALPASSGEKTGFAVTAFLALAVFLTIISAELPRTADKVSTFSAYLFLVTFLSALISMITIIQLRLFAREPEVPVPSSLQSLTKCIRRMRCRTCFAKSGGYVRGLTIEEVKRRLSDDVTWEDAVGALDFVFFWVFLFLIAGITSGCCVIAVKGALA
ncbi:ACHA7-like protein [Mya arenaria]|uniref:ACHA7-like protein n=1 Tax=Mya arenaria TaxID=6604 RepID=A0ABY7FIB6_MYAAR|nr:acetylcholine receptor subunit beta-like [Mya arenaria]WAR21840.1 ACHA7-like protein [Mya arenaria]